MKDQLSTSGTSFPIRLYHPARQAVMNAVGIGFMAVFLLLPGLSFAGTLDSPAAPTVAGSAMFTITDIYNRLNTGAAVTKRVGTFTEPSAGPAATGNTLDQVMGKAPVADNVNGAVTGEVGNGKTFWGLRTGGTWGLQTGTLSTQSLSPANDTVAAGIYTATTLSAVDADLATGNIKSGVTIFGVVG
ncbi:MAG: hypothetical protein Q9M82_05050, partial [Mariprofundus sp.]|nr:hypothetical protein [Mariprofundus sp.]